VGALVTRLHSDVSTLLRAWSDGDHGALDALTPIVYAELRRLAHRYMRRERADHSLQTTALVNEATSASSTTSGCSGRIARTSSPSPRN
jgi:ECF sigma factor